MECIKCGKSLGAIAYVCQSCGTAQPSVAPGNAVTLEHGGKPARRPGPIRRFLGGFWAMIDAISNIADIFR